MDKDPFGETIEWEKNPSLVTTMDSPHVGRSGKLCHPEFAWRHIKSTHAPLEHVIRYQGRVLEIHRSTISKHVVVVRNRNSGTFVFLQLREYDNHEKGQFYAAIEFAAADGAIM